MIPIDSPANAEAAGDEQRDDQVPRLLEDEHRAIQPAREIVDGVEDASFGRSYRAVARGEPTEPEHREAATGRGDIGAG